MKRLLVLLCGLLVAIISLELSSASSRDDTVPQGSVEARAVKVVTGLGAPDAKLVGQWATSTLARPLFAPGRKPEVGSVTADAGLPRLTGIIFFSKYGVAIFEASGNRKPVAVREGETVGGWEVTTIAAGEVSLRKASNRLVLKPQFQNAVPEVVTKPVKG